MSKPHKYIKNSEFINLEKFVWEGPNRLGNSISQIEKSVSRESTHKASADKPIWHSKAGLDKFVAKEIGILDGK